MKISMLKTKLHRGTVTEADLNYEGSISIDRALCEKARLLPYEKVEIYNCNNGARFATYVIYGDSGQICLNGAAARMAHKGDTVIICSYCELEEDEALAHKPTVLLLNESNQVRS